jgi:hypothetical protein
MGKKIQTIFIAFIFLGLILISAGVGALAARERFFGSIFGISGAAVLVITIIVMVIVRMRTNKTPD